MYSIYNKYGEEICKVNSLEYQGEFMSVSKVVATIKSHNVIEFNTGDYIDFRGERFTLRYTPAVSKCARPNTYGEGFVYENITFYAPSDELTRCDFIDIVEEDNKIHFTSLPTFSFYAESVEELASRIQANLDRLYTGDNKWSVSVADGTISKPHNFSVQNIKCWDALVLANTELDLNFVINGRNIVIGSVGSSIEHDFKYGKGNGLKQIATNTSDNYAIITRLRAYGSTRNLPYRYYNKLYVDANGNVSYLKDKPSSGYTPLISESMYLPNLMLPMLRDASLIGKTGDLYNKDGVLCGTYKLGGIKGEDAYIDSIGGIEKYGINEGTVFFDNDGSENDDDNIYPSMEGMTAKALIDAGYSITLDEGDNGNLDEILSAEQMTDDGIIENEGGNIGQKTFSVTLKDIGFDISDYLLPGETAKISFKSGALVGREFDITSITKSGKKQILTLARYLDDDIQWVFPNKVYNAQAGDKFVLLNIYMPDAYIVAAEYGRLLERAKLYLAENDHNAITYLPTIDDIFLARHSEIAEVIKEGDIFTFSDDDLGISKSITISALTIKIGESLIPKYEVTLSETKDATLVDRITTKVSESLGKTILQPNNILSQSKLAFDKRYLRKDTEDSAAKHITFQDGATIIGSAAIDFVDAKGISAKTGEIETITADSIRSNNYSAVSGYRMENVDGDSVIDIDKLYVRKKAIFTELDIKSLKHIGGAILLSPASCKIASVEDVMSGSTITGYKCYFLATDGEETINNEWVVGDQAICNKYNITKLHHYWRLVTAVSASPINGHHYVVLSATDCDDFSNVPQAGDEIVCLGNRNDVDRQGAIFLNSEGTDAPSLLQLNGINSYSLESKNIITQLSKSRNIIRGQQVEVITESGNKSVKQFADEALAGANSYSDSVGNALKEFVGERETYLQAQITQNASDITLRANKTTVDAIEGRVSNAEAKIQVNAGNINLKADKTTVDVIDGRVSKAEADIQVNSDGLSSVVSKQEKVGVEFETSRWVGDDGFDYLVFKNGGGYYVLYSKDPQADYDRYTLLTIENVSAGDKIHIEGNNMFIHIIGCDGDYQGAEYDFGQEYPSEAGNYNVLGFGDDQYSDDGVSVVDWVATSNWAKVYIMLTDDNPSAYQTAKTTLIRSAYTAESRIKQTADSIEAKVGNTGIDINNKQITLSASNTIVKGDLSVQKVMTYYPNGSVKSAYNGNGNGTIVYYYPIESSEVGYPFGQEMRIDDFVYDDNGNSVGMKTIYFKQDGGVAWVLSSSGLETTLSEYWSYLYDRVFDTDLVSLKAKIDQYKMNLAANLPDNISDFSQFHSTTQTDKDGRIVKGRMATSALPPPKPDWYYSGVFCLNQPLEVLVPRNEAPVPKNKYYPYWVVSNGIITEQGNYYFAP